MKFEDWLAFTPALSPGEGVVAGQRWDCAERRRQKAAKIS